MMWIVFSFSFFLILLFIFVCSGSWMLRWLSVVAESGVGEAPLVAVLRFLIVLPFVVQHRL